MNDKASLKTMQQIIALEPGALAGSRDVWFEYDSRGMCRDELSPPIIESLPRYGLKECGGKILAPDPTSDEFGAALRDLVAQREEDFMKWPAQHKLVNTFNTSWNTDNECHTRATAWREYLEETK